MTPLALTVLVAGKPLAAALSASALALALACRRAALSALDGPAAVRRRFRR